MMMRCSPQESMIIIHNCNQGFKKLFVVFCLNSRGNFKKTIALSPNECFQTSQCSLFLFLVLLVMGIPQIHLPHSDSTPRGSPCPWTPLGRFHQTPGESGHRKDQIDIADKLPASFTSISEEFPHSLSSVGKLGV